MQRVFHKTDGSAYKSISRSAWYKQLTSQEQALADQMHLDPTTHTPKGTGNTVAYVRAEAAKRALAASTTPSAPSSTVATPSPSMAVSTPPPPTVATTPSAPATSTSANDFFGRIGYGSGYRNTANVEADDDTDVTTASQGSDHYRGLLLKDLDKARQEEIDAGDSSESEDEVGSDLDRRQRRRQIKASHLTAIARTFWPLSDPEMDFFGQLSAKRERDNKARSTKRQMYARDTREQFEEVGEQFKLTNFHHNPYLRRAVRKAWPKEKIKGGGSAEYDKQQGKVREHLLKVVAADHETMKWKREDFPDDETWQAVQWMAKNEVGNSSTLPLYHEKADAGEDTTGTSARVGFHHEAFKEAMGGIFAPYALTPVNLTALNDRRELLNASKVKKLKESGQSLPPVGAHDKFGHQGSGFMKDQKGKMARSKGGGQFSDMDAEAVYHVTRPLYQRRTPKARLYDVPPSTATSVPTPTATTAPAPMDVSSTATSVPVTPSPSIVSATPTVPSPSFASATPSSPSFNATTLYSPTSHASPFTTSPFSPFGGTTPSAPLLPSASHAPPVINPFSITTPMAPVHPPTSHAPPVTNPFSLSTMMAPVHPLTSHASPFTIPTSHPFGSTTPSLPAFPFPPISSLFGTPFPSVTTPSPPFSVPTTTPPFAATATPTGGGTPPRPRKRRRSAMTPVATPSPSPGPRKKRPRLDPPS